MRRNLVVVRAGDASLHPTWLPLSGQRSWDLVVNYFGDDPHRHHAPDVQRIDGKGPKWQGLHRLFTAHPQLLERYDYIWLPDDDLLVNPPDIDRLFALMRRHDLLLAQPALTPQSHWSWTITLRNPATTLRHTNFVEVMLPCFRADLLRRALPGFAPYATGSGFDWAWPAMAGCDEGRVAVLDTVTATHTRPFGGPNYAFFAGHGYGAEDEIGHVLATHGIAGTATRILSLRTRLGLHLRGDSPAGRAMLRAGYRLTIAEAYLRRAPYRWELHKRLRQSFATPDQPPERMPPNDGSRFTAALARGDLAGS